MSGEQVNLLDIFKQVSKTMKNNQSELNEADDYNHDHGDHMVEIFEVITAAMKEKKNADPADQLEYAAQLLRNKSTSGSAQMYAKGLTEASKEISGKSVDLNTVVPLLQTLLSGGEAKTTAAASKDSGLGDLLGSLLGGGTTAQAAESSDQGLDISDLLGAGLSYMQSKQSGSSDIEALTKALVNSTQTGEKTYRSQSSELVTNTVLQALSGLMTK
ncbi:MAG TPA: hypothetical protein DCK95_03505 [Anaerolineaceae bacterium]|nr:hypothetical protein [Anaerolineaceae bacterium]